MTTGAPISHVAAASIVMALPGRTAAARASKSWSGIRRPAGADSLRTTLRSLAREDGVENHSPGTAAV